MAEDADPDAVFLGEDDAGEVVADLGDEDAGAGAFFFFFQFARASDSLATRRRAPGAGRTPPTRLAV